LKTVRQHERRLLVEGEEDKFAIVELMGHHTDWPNDKLGAPVWLEPVGSVESILAEGFVSAKLYESGTKILGAVLDADAQFDSRWSRVNQICSGLFANVPPQMPAEGLILQDSPEGPRLGVWIMPDNRQHGMLETFLKGLVTEAPLLEYAQSVVVEARKRTAPCKDVHIEKAEIHSWLAWQDPPGQALGRAITSLTLNPRSDSAQPFVDWFLKLYRLQPTFP
jgi:hypothetical protein